VADSAEALLKNDKPDSWKGGPSEQSSEQIILPTQEEEKVGAQMDVQMPE